MTAHLPDPERSRAVLIGTSYFSSDRLVDLPSVGTNLIDLSDALTDKHTGVLAREHCLIIDNPESWGSLEWRLERAIAQADDLLLVYYSGHGLRHDVRHQQLYLSVRETDPNRLSSTAVPFDDVRELIENSPARVKILILDCCYSGLALGAMSGSVVDGHDVEIRGTTVITSSASDRISLAPPGERNTAFTAELLSLLVNGPPMPGEQLSVHQFYYLLMARMKRRAELPRPKGRVGDTSGLLLLRKTDPPKPPPIPLSAPPAPVPAPVPRQPVSAPSPPEVIERVISVLQPARTTNIFTDPIIPTVESSPTGAGKATLSLTATALLWGGFVLGQTFAVGGLAGSIFGTPPPGATSSADLPTGLVMLGVALGCGLVILRRRKRFARSHDRAPKLSEVYPALAASLDKPRTVVLWIALIFCIGMAITGSFAGSTTRTGPSGGAQMSDVLLTVSLVQVFLWGAGACGYALWQRRSRGRISG